MHVSQSITIKAPVQKVFPLVADFNNWNKWSPWKQQDTTLHYTTNGTPATVGHQVNWTSKREGNGHQTITRILPLQTIDYQIAFSENPSVHAVSNWTFSGDSTYTRVNWSLHVQDEPFLVRGLILSLNVQNTLSTYYQNGLSALRMLAEPE
jgi:ribosome-associated toxin RatA of RatAB toxin-antitoxin module